MDTVTFNSGLRRQVIREACAWFIEFRTADASAATRERFDDWLRHSPEHIQAYLEVAAAWAVLPTQLAAGHLDIEQWVERARASGDEDVVVSLAERAASAREPQEPGPGAGGRRPFLNRALAAGIAAVVVAGIAGWLSWRGETYTTGIGEQRTIRLGDDSIVDLNARSSIRVRFSRSERSIDLVEGQAMFHVARDPRRPFIVHSDNTAVQAVGTQFDVYRKDDALVVTVVEGRVAVIPPPLESVASPAQVSNAPAPEAGAGELLAAGEQLTVTPKTVVSKPHQADVGAATAWIQRRLVFDDTPLAEVAEEFNRYSVRRLVIDDAELARKTISGAYSSSDPASLIGFLRAQPSLEVTETDREIRVRRHGAAGAASSPQ